MPDIDDAAPAAPPKKVGFLPIQTNAFDRVFIGVVAFVAIHLAWMRFVEASIPLYVATILSVLVGALIVAKG
jgi:predicted small integral membrane protein